MSARVEFNELNMWYELPERDQDGEKQYTKCRKDIFIINYQEKKVTVAIDKVIRADDGSELVIQGYMVTDSFDKFEANIP